jgi:hypothetical protein
MTTLNYLEALETRLGWLRWLNAEEGRSTLAEFQNAYNDNTTTYFTLMQALEMFLGSNGGTYYVAPPFCSMVEQLRDTVPDSLQLEPQWILSESGFAVFADHLDDRPVEGGSPYLNRIDALAWVPQGDGLIVATLSDLAKHPRRTFSYGFVPVTIVGIPFHSSIGDIEQYRLDKARAGGGVVRVNSKDCIHLAYSTLYLMAQKLATSRSFDSNRAQRRRAEQEQAPFEPAVRVITLRRAEQHAAHDSQSSHSVDWRCQWLVRWHWRWQYCPSTGEHKWVAVDTYVKGPPDKPLKQPNANIFVAKR